MPAQIRSCLRPAPCGTLISRRILRTHTRMDERVSKRVEKAIAEKVFPGCVICVIHKDARREVLSFGTTTYGSAGEKVSESTVYDIASITKSIPTASLTLLFVNQGTLSLADKVKTYVPELQNDHGATIEDLLRYRVRGVQLSRLRYRTFEEVRTHALERGFDAPPGESAYTNLPAFILGLA